MPDDTLRESSTRLNYKMEVVPLQRVLQASLASNNLPVQSCTTPAILEKCTTSAASRDIIMGVWVCRVALYYLPISCFQKTYQLKTHGVDHDIGGYSDDKTCEYLGFECGEANLDVQTIMAVAQEIDMTYYGNDETTTFAHWLSDVAVTPCAFH